MSDDYINREDAINTIRNAFTGMTADTLELRINDIPPADVAPVVRCKDCFLYGECQAAKFYGDDGYCSVGEEMHRTSCDTCKHSAKGWDECPCDVCTTADSHWERKDDE